MLMFFYHNKKDLSIEGLTFCSIRQMAQKILSKIVFYWNFKENQREKMKKMV